MYANLTQLNNELTGCNKSKGRLKRCYRFQTTFFTTFLFLHADQHPTHDQSCRC